MPTVKDLREEAERYVLRGYSTIRKPALIQLIGSHVLNQQLAQFRAPVLRQNAPAIQVVNNLLDEPIPVSRGDRKEAAETFGSTPSNSAFCCTDSQAQT